MIEIDGVNVEDAAVLAAIAGDIFMGAPVRTAGRLLNGAVTSSGAHQGAAVHRGPVHVPGPPDEIVYVPVL